jgi:hypothetical protein
MTAPIGPHVRKVLEAMRNTVVELLFLWICFVVCFADTLCNHVSVAFPVASVFAVCALHTGRVFEEVSAQGTSHDVVELLLNEFVAVHFVYLLLSLTNSTFTVKTQVNWSSIFHLLG